MLEPGQASRVHAFVETLLTDSKSAMHKEAVEKEALLWQTKPSLTSTSSWENWLQISLVLPVWEGVFDK